MASHPRKICRFPTRCPITKTNNAQPVMAMMYFLPSDEFQIREKRFIKFAASDERNESTDRAPGASTGACGTRLCAKHQSQRCGWSLTQPRSANCTTHSL